MTRREKPTGMPLAWRWSNRRSLPVVDLCAIRQTGSEACSDGRAAAEPAIHNDADYNGQVVEELGELRESTQRKA